MKKLSLDLKKYSTIKLTENEVNSIDGGGYNRSQRRDGDCKYSRNDPTFLPCGEVTGCYPPCP